MRHFYLLPATRKRKSYQYRPPTAKEIQNVITLLELFPSAQEIAISELAKLK